MRGCRPTTCLKGVVCQLGEMCLDDDFREGESNKATDVEDDKQNNKCIMIDPCHKNVH